jgi:hypothetical protein
MHDFEKIRPVLDETVFFCEVVIAGGQQPRSAFVIVEDLSSLSSAVQQQFGHSPSDVAINTQQQDGAAGYVQV